MITRNQEDRSTLADLIVKGFRAYNPPEGFSLGDRVARRYYLSLGLEVYHNKYLDVVLVRDAKS